jgi:hypothetical protein
MAVKLIVDVKTYLTQYETSRGKVTVKSLIDMELPSAGMLRGISWSLVTQVSEQNIDFIFKDQTTSDCLNLGRQDGCCLETTVTSYHYTPRNIHEDRRPLVRRGGDMIFCTKSDVFSDEKALQKLISQHLLPNFQF